jgi:hypothetical protein
MTPLNPAPTTAMTGAGFGGMRKLYEIDRIFWAIVRQVASRVGDMRSANAAYCAARYINL